MPTPSWQFCLLSLLIHLSRYGWIPSILPTSCSGTGHDFSTSQLNCTSGLSVNVLCGFASWTSSRPPPMVL
ncbi:mCG121989 [Mus musculus]|nr:mCG121989 [Mus musculus]